MTLGDSARSQPQTEPQAVDYPLTRSSVFLVLTVHDDASSVDTARATVAGIGDLVKDVALRDLTRSVSCTVGIGARIWPALVRGPAPAELHPFRVVEGQVHTAVSTPGDLFFHIRADRPDYVFELERIILAALDGAVHVEDETVGFRYFDARDLLGFVDGTANPVGAELPEATIVGAEDPAFAGGSYLVVQKYLHPLDQWQALPTEMQEAIIGRTKPDNIELDDATGDAQKSHKTLTTIVDADGTELDVLRDNMPFGRPGAGEFGTYFIAYSRRLWVVEQMLERMFIGDPPGKHDRILDFSTAVTGSVFFVPSASFLDSLADDDAVPDTTGTESSPPVSGDEPVATPAAPSDGSLGLGALRSTPTERNS
ncbi:Dyp-type peroxidase [Pseudoclavibacter chungangensis]|uniref:Dyp-type peroxidase n=1 Tax=Pseudoclavibacter chungangensis TaxID=587635 RepID=A0A7J5BR09_9MICO|nr:Dyp-type peroxidase [Pseudoclavibacter chungangensis]KAB1656723.1 Dyp-type peroxidase [Pseudoclavibacter chungangensis]NYJ67822.1 putative iron-dependent peroxidase [Pseudoclavibacter chungangensis]